MQNLLQDIRYAIRSLRRTPAFTLVAACTLALGIGANAAIFSVVKTVLLQPLPYRDAGRVVMIWSRWVGWDKTWVSEAELLDFRTARSLRGAGAWSTGQVNLTGEGAPERLGAAEITPNLFPVLGVAPALGRVFTSEEAREGRTDVVILSHELWERRFGSSRSILNRRIRIDGRSVVVVGVMPPRFQLPTDYTEDFSEPTRLWLPLVINDAQPERGNHGLYAAARLAPGATLDRANAELKTIIDARTREGLYHPAVHQGALAVPLDEQILGDVRPRVFLLLGAVAFLLLIACTNIANLLLARAEGRLREIALRTALGAGRRRLVAQLLTESGVLALLGAILGVFLAWIGVRLLTAWAPASIPRIGEVSVDWTVVLFALAVSMSTSLLFGLAPVIRLLGLDLVESLKEGGHGATVGVARQRVRGTLVAGEVAVALVLLMCAGLMVRTLWALHHVDLGFRPDHVLTMSVAMPQADYPEADQVVQFYQRAVERLRSLPGIRAAGAIRSLPLGSTIGDWGLDIDGYVETPGNNAKGDWQVVTDGAFETLGERLIEGRFFTPADRADSAQVAIVNQTLASKYWGTKSPLGGRMRMGARDEAPWFTVVGVVGDLRHNGLIAPVNEKFYRPHAQFAQSTGNAPRSMTLVLRTAGDPLSVAGAARGAIASLDPNVPISGIRPMMDVVSSSMASSSFTGLLLATFAGLALVLAGIGLYGVLAYLVTQRTREIGIRAALGATPRGIVGLILRHSAMVTIVGLVVGLATALAAARAMGSLLYGVEPRDPVTFLAVSGALAGVAIVASVIPAWRAARVDPLVALRTE
jgi:putative ABC transport system permease protein